RPQTCRRHSAETGSQAICARWSSHIARSRTGAKTLGLQTFCARCCAHGRWCSVATACRTRSFTTLSARSMKRWPGFVASRRLRPGRHGGRRKRRRSSSLRDCVAIHSTKRKNILSQECRYGRLAQRKGERMAYRYGSREQLGLFPQSIEDYVSKEDPVRV